MADYNSTILQIVTKNSDNPEQSNKNLNLNESDLSFDKNVKIQFVHVNDILNLRSRVLRPGQDILRCQFPEDNEPTTFHLGLIFDVNNFDKEMTSNQHMENYSSDKKVVCTGTFIKQNHSDIFFSNAKNAYRLRGMATDTNFQGNNLGSILLQTAIMILKSNNCDLLWFNAREKAYSFYCNNGFQYYGESFDIQDIGPHKVM